MFDQDPNGIFVNETGIHNFMLFTPIKTRPLLSYMINHLFMDSEKLRIEIIELLITPLHI
jgi:hypothetical protein